MYLHAFPFNIVHSSTAANMAAMRNIKFAYETFTGLNECNTNVSVQRKCSSEQSSVRRQRILCYNIQYIMPVSIVRWLQELCMQFVFGATAPHWTRASSFTRFLDYIQRRTTVGRTPLDEGSARRRDLYLTTYNVHNRQTSTPPVGFEPIIPASERPQTYTLDRAATGTGPAPSRRRK